MAKVFVYGTLRAGGRLHGHMRHEGIEYVGAGRVRGFVMYDVGSFPAVEPTPYTGSMVRGEVYEVDEPGLARLDRVEGVPRMYQRCTVTVWQDDGTPTEAFIYSMPPGKAARWGREAGGLVLGGDWMRYLADSEVAQ